jgi:formylglycine-generating enzyme required for sulfatase activity
MLMATMAQDQPSPLADRFHATRALSCALAAPLSDADATIQPHPDASPAKWHLAHTSWFFETFILRDHVAGYRHFDESWSFLFNSYYEGEGERQPRARRGMLSRPSLAEILDYRAHVDAALAEALPVLGEEALTLVELGLNHEQQHQELMTEHPGGIVQIGQGGEGFSFDCEAPRHEVLLRPYALADRLVTNREWLRFTDDGGYCRPDLWLSDGWAWVREKEVRAPLHWHEGGGGWQRFGLDGLRPISEAEPVCHLSYYEADAFARWAEARLPTEAEWEAAACSADPAGGNQLDEAGPVRPRGTASLFGDVWQWTASAFLPYPGFRPAAGTVGEYNGKFMSGQMVLRGASCATPRGHSRATYRNFFYPHQRWMFAGLRLARDL